jgi:hypothetical protein
LSTNTWGATHAEQLRLRLARITDGGEVLVAVAVDLAGTHDHVATAAPHHVEDRPERDVALDHALGVHRTDRDRVRHEHRDGVGHHQVRFERLAGQPAAAHRHHTDRVAQDLAVAAERLGDRRDTHLVERDVTHLDPPRAAMALT